VTEASCSPPSSDIIILSLYAKRKIYKDILVGTLHPYAKMAWSLDLLALLSNENAHSLFI
jgi:hypothetical protein